MWSTLGFCSYTLLSPVSSSAYKTVSGVNGPLVILDQVKVKDRLKAFSSQVFSGADSGLPAVPEVRRNRPSHAA